MTFHTFQIVNVPDDAADLTEQLGTKPKVWFQGKEYLFKEGNPNTGNDWAEKVASALCDLLDLPHAVYDLAIWRGKRGVICPNFVPKGGRLDHGNELLMTEVAIELALRLLDLNRQRLLALSEDLG